MAKGKKSVSHAGPHKSHGPKRKMFHQWDSTMRLYLGRNGLLNKHHNIESFTLSCQSRGLKGGTPAEWQARFTEFRKLETSKEKTAWLAGCKKHK